MFCAFLWLILTVVAALALVVGCLGVWRRPTGPGLAVKRLKFAIFGCCLALLFLVFEISLVAWDAFFLLEDEGYFFEQLQPSIVRAAFNLATLFLSWLACRMEKKRLGL